MGNLRAAAIAAALTLLGTFQSHADDVTITSRDGSVKLSGTLLDYDGEFYRVETVYGPLTVDGSGVRCEGTGCPDLASFVPEIGLSGARSLSKVLVPALLETFAAREGYSARRKVIDDDHFTYELTETETSSVAARFTFRASTTDEGFADLLADEADIALSLREATPRELEMAGGTTVGDLNDPARSLIIGLDGLVPVVAPSNPIQTISMGDLARLYAGEITNWSEVGGPDSPVELHLPETSTGLTAVIVDRILAPYELTLNDGITQHATSAALADAVASNPFAIGLAAFSDTGNARSLPLTGSCGFRATATTRAIKTEDYPLTTPLFLYIPERRLPKIGREFLGFVRSGFAQPVVRRSRFVDLQTDEIPVALQGQRLANAISSAGREIGLRDLKRIVATMDGVQRLTVTFRFRNGSTELDAQSNSNSALLASAIERGIYDGRELIFVGFSDGYGPSTDNQRLASERAEAVRQAVLAAAPSADLELVGTSVEAFGEAMPLACDDEEWGRKINRRVEVWLR